ncbi:MAG: energy-coupling factor transporter transmembrane component T [Nitrososphaerota archaeon]
MSPRTLNPSVKLVFLAYIFTLASLLNMLQHLLYLLLLTLVLALVSHVKPSGLLRVFVGVAPMAFGLGWFNTAVSGDITYLPMVVLKIYILTTATAYFASTTDPTTFFHSLVQNLRLPYSFSLPLSLAYLILKDLLTWYVEAVHSLRGRWILTRSWETPFRLRLVGVMLLNYVSGRLETLAEALEVRCFTTARKPWRKIAVTGWDYIFITVLVSATVSTIILTA